MNPSSIFKHKITQLLLALVLCGTVQTIWAQDAAEKAAKPEPNAKESGASKKTPPKKITPPLGSNDSPFDYKASEEISQDLSVSFPVDI